MLNLTSGRSHCREYESHPWPASRHWVVVRSAYLGSISVCIVDTGVVALVQPLRGNGGRGEVRESDHLPTSQAQAQAQEATSLQKDVGH